MRAYRRAARLVGELPRNVADMLAEGEDLDELPGIGKDLVDKIVTIARGGRLPMLDQLARKVPAGITAQHALPRLGPKRVHLPYDKLGIDSIDKLQAAVGAGKLRTLPEIGAAIEAKLLRAIAEGRSAATHQAGDRRTDRRSPGSTNLKSGVCYAKDFAVVANSLQR